MIFLDYSRVHRGSRPCDGVARHMYFGTQREWPTKKHVPEKKPFRTDGYRGGNETGCTVHHPSLLSWDCVTTLLWIAVVESKNVQMFSIERVQKRWYLNTRLEAHMYQTAKNTVPKVLEKQLSLLILGMNLVNTRNSVLNDLKPAIRLVGKKSLKMSFPFGFITRRCNVFLTLLLMTETSKLNIL